MMTGFGLIASIVFIALVPAVPGGLATVVTLGQMTRTLGN